MLPPKRWLFSSCCSLILTWCGKWLLCFTLSNQISFCGIDTLWSFSIGTAVEYKEVAIASRHFFLMQCQRSWVHLCPEWWVYPIKVSPQRAPHTKLYRHHCYLILCRLLCTPLSISLLVQHSQVAWAMISNFYHYVSCLHNSCPPFFLTVPWREHERGIPPCSNKTQRTCFGGGREKIMLHF